MVPLQCEHNTHISNVDTNNDKMIKENLDSDKEFLLSNVIDENILLPFKFYSDLSVGVYICLKFIYVKDTYFFGGKHKSKSGFYDFSLLLCSTSEQCLFHLFPCYYTTKQMRELFDSSFLNESDNVVILEKRMNKANVRRLPSPLCSEDKLLNHFEQFSQIYVCDVYSLDDEDAGNITKMITKRGKEFIDFCLDQNR